MEYFSFHSEERSKICGHYSLSSMKTLSLIQSRKKLTSLITRIVPLAMPDYFQNHSIFEKSSHDD